MLRCGDGCILWSVYAGVRFKMSGHIFDRLVQVPADYADIACTLNGKNFTDGNAFLFECTDYADQLPEKDVICGIRAIECRINSEMNFQYQ